MSARVHWNAGPENISADSTGAGSVHQAVKTAMMAMPVEDWECRVKETGVELSAAKGLAAIKDEADERQLMLRCGAALFHLKLGVRRFGRLGRVRLFPDLQEPGLIASVQYLPNSGGVPDARASRSALTGSKLSAALPAFGTIEHESRSSLSTSVKEPAWLDFSQSLASRSQLEAMAKAEENIPVTPAGRVVDFSRVTEWAKPLFSLAVRTGENSRVHVSVGTPRISQMASLAVLKTKTDDRLGWVSAGEILERCKIETRAASASFRVFEHSFRHRQAREQLRHCVGRKGFAQAIVGFGKNHAEILKRTETRSSLNAQPRD